MEVLFFIKKYSDVVTALSAVVVSCVAIYGLREWKRQTKGKTDYEIARRYLKSALNLRDSITYVRNPFISINEMQTALKEHGFSEDEYSDNMKKNMAVYSTRWKKVQEAQTNLEIELLEAEVSWGAEAVRVSRKLSSLTRKLFAELQMYISGYRQNIKDELIYNQGDFDNPDDFSIKLNEGIEEIREFLKPHLL